jgi:AAA domain-containing protein
VDKRDDQRFKPTIVRGDFSNPPPALAPLRARPQWVIWRLTWRAGWTKPPFRCDDPHRFASSADPSSWSSYEAAAAAAAAGDGITYVLTPEEPFAAVDIDHVCDPVTGTIETWAQRLLDQASHTYVEVSPSGCGLRIWGTAKGEELHRKFELDTAALELFRRTRKPLTVTGLQLGNSQQLGPIDALLDRAVIWAQQYRQKLSRAKPASSSVTAGMAAQYSIAEIEKIVREGAPDGANRSDTFHAIVGHYLGCGWSVEQIVAVLEEHSDGIGGRYLAESRLAGEVERSAKKYRPLEQQPELWSTNWKQESEPHRPELELAPEPEPELEQNREPEPEPEPESGPEPEPEPEPEFEEDPPGAEPELPPMFAHGDPDPRPVKRWTIRKLMPACGCGLLSGQWGTFKSFMALEIAAAVMTGQPINTYTMQRQCGVLFLPAEGADEMRVRLEALVREKCGSVARAPFRWFEAVPALLHRGGLELLIAMARQADASLQQEFGLPLGLVFIDTVAASAGYAMQGAESDSAVGQQVMRVMRQAAEDGQLLVRHRSLRQEHRPWYPRQLQQGGSRRPGTGLPGPART